MATLWLDLAVNVLSTLLLGASNNCAQLLSSPERKDVDKAHLSGKWLDIGVPSARNLWRIDLKRRALWFLLFASSTPIHLLFNSVLFQELTANEYVAALVTEDFLTGGSYNLSSNTADGYDFNRDASDLVSLISAMQLKAQNGTLQRLDNKECLQKYDDSALLSDYSNVLAVVTTTSGATPESSQQNSIIQMSLQLKWYCNAASYDDRCSFQTLIADPSSWSIEHLPEACSLDGSENSHGQKCNDTLTAHVQYCLAEQFAPNCEIKASPSMLLAVIVCNVVKLGCLIWVLCQPSFEPLATVGDAISSFLTHPDTTTRGLGPLSSTQVRKSRTSRISREPVWRKTTMRWAATSGVLRWTFCFMLSALFWAVGMALLARLPTNIERSRIDPGFSPALLWAENLGSANTEHTVIVSQRLPLLANVLLVNTPQLLVSMVYLFYNNLLTCMLLGRETSAFAAKRKPLRTTAPTGHQNSTYWLQLPFRYSIPLMALMAVLHWLVSRSIFLFEVTFYNLHGNLVQDFSTNACGYSGQAIILALSLGALIMLMLFGLTLRKLTPGIPAMGSCSMAISAACHANPQERKPEVLELMYGVVPGSGLDEQGREHVGFSSREVWPLVHGVAYY
jgi:hypothetical protein